MALGLALGAAGAAPDSTGSAVYAESEGTLTVGSKTAKTVTVHIDKDSKVLLTLPQDSIAKDKKFTEHIEEAAGKLGAHPSLSVNGTTFNAYYNAKEELSYPANCALIMQTLVDKGEVIVAGGDSYKATLGFTSDGKVLIDYVRIEPYIAVSGHNLYPWGINSYFENSGAVLYFNDKLGYPVDIPASSTVYTIQDGKVVSRSKGGTFEPGKGEALLVINSGFDFSTNIGATVKMKLNIAPTFGSSADWNKITTAIACGPFLLADGEIKTSINSETAEKMGNDFVAGRTFAAVDYGNNLTIGVVSASPNQIAEALKAAGYKDAMLLDGGGSSALSSSTKLYSNPGRLLSNVLHILESGVETAEIPFTDVKKVAYYYDAVKWAYENNITKGESATKFGPSSLCTRGQVVTFLWRSAGEPEPKKTENIFTDIKESDYFYKAVLWAIEKGITNGASPTEFEPETACLNEHILTFIWRYKGEPEKTADAPKYYSDAMSWAGRAGMLEGVGTVDPEWACPRANVVQFLYKCK